MEKLSFPNRITVELTNDCNVSCTFCNRQKIVMDIGYMDETLYYRIIDEMAQHLPIKLVPFFRGEPLMHPQIITFIKYAKKKGIGPIQMASNALLLDEKMQDELIDSGIDYISFSLDTTDPEIYKCSRLSGDLNISSRNVETMGLKCKERKRKDYTRLRFRYPQSISRSIYRDKRNLLKNGVRMLMWYGYTNSMMKKGGW